MQITNLLVFALEFIILIVAGQFVLNLNTKNFDDDAAVKGGNKAIGIRRFGGFVALTFAIAAAFIGSYSGDLVQDASEIAIYGTIGIGSILLGIFKSDYLLSPGLQNNIAIKAGNKAVAVFEAYVMSAIGIITFAAWAHDGSFVGGLVYYISGLLLFYLIGLIYRNRVDACEIEKDANEFVAHRKGIILLGYSVILWACMYGPLEKNISILQSMISFGGSALLSLSAYTIIILTIGGQLIGSKYSKYEPYIIGLTSIAVAIVVRTY